MSNRHDSLRAAFARATVNYPYRWRGQLVTKPGRGCRRWVGDRWCGRTDGLREYPYGPLCPDHQPAWSARTLPAPGASLRDRAPDPPQPPAVDHAASGRCCGERPFGRAGGPLLLACQLCRKSPTYWRNQ